MTELKKKEQYRNGRQVHRGRQVRGRHRAAAAPLAEFPAGTGAHKAETSKSEAPGREADAGASRKSTLAARRKTVPASPAASVSSSGSASSARPLRAVLLFLLVFLLSAAAGYRYTALHEDPVMPSDGAAETGAVRILENCNVRKAAGTGAEVIGGGKKNQIFEYAGKTEITGEDNKWYSIYYEDTIGWVSEAVAAFTPDE